METIQLDQDIAVFCAQAKSFPEGIMEAFRALENISPEISARPFYGISYMQDGKIIYKAAVREEREGEAEQYGLERFVIRKGQYLGVTIRDFRKNVPEIGKSFQRLLTTPELDTSSYCLEEYKGEDVLCMVRLRD